MLSIGQRAPSLVAGSTLGTPFALDALRGKIVVVYFFRRAFTRFCTVQTKGFRDNYPDLRAIGAEVVGVSSDEFATQCEFARAHDVTFPMIADVDNAIARRFDVFFHFLPFAHRVTYVIDRRGVVAGVFSHEFQMSKHLDEVVRFVRSISGEAAAVNPR